MKKPNMILWNFEIPEQDLINLKKLSELSGDSASRITRIALKNYVRKELKKYE
jgi:hypothetical protein